MNRHEARIYAINILYDIDINQQDVVSVGNSWQTIAEYVHAAQVDFWESTGEKNIALESDDWNSDPFLADLVNCVLKHFTTIDQVLTKALQNWTIDRLSYVDRAIVRLAAAEMLYLGTPNEIAIDEALELTKQFSNIDDDNRQVKFTNRLLDSLVGVIKNEQ